VSDFSKYLQHPSNRQQLSFMLRGGGFDTRDHQGGPTAPDRPQMADAGWKVRRQMAEMQEINRKTAPLPEGPADPFRNPPVPRPGQFDPAKEQFCGAVMGIALSSHRDANGHDRFVILPGEDIKLTFPTAGTPPKAISDNFTIVDFYESKMSEYDASFVFVPIERLQELRGMIDPTTGTRFATAIQIKLKPGADLDAVRDRLRAAFPPHLFGVYTWRDKQGPLLAAVQMETAILNLILFAIIVVAGFGILAVFFMIVVEKTRDIGVLKSLGANSAGIMGIFLSYGLSLGLVGSGVGLGIGLLFVKNINTIADTLARVTGHKVFDPAIYYFYSIPTIIDPATIFWIMFGALLIAVLASVWPAIRAATLRPVEALRYE
jgi:lipoprotein-releasing system permease protein